MRTVALSQKSTSLLLIFAQFCGNPSLILNVPCKRYKSERMVSGMQSLNLMNEVLNTSYESKMALLEDMISKERLQELANLRYSKLRAIYLLCDKNMVHVRKFTEWCNLDLKFLQDFTRDSTATVYTTDGMEAYLQAHLFVFSPILNELLAKQLPQPVFATVDDYVAYWQNPLALNLLMRAVKPLVAEFFMDHVLKPAAKTLIQQQVQGNPIHGLTVGASMQLFIALIQEWLFEYIRDYMQTQLALNDTKMALKLSAVKRNGVRDTYALNAMKEAYDQDVTYGETLARLRNLLDKMYSVFKSDYETIYQLLYSERNEMNTLLGMVLKYPHPILWHLLATVKHTKNRLERKIQLF